MTQPQVPRLAIVVLIALASAPMLWWGAQRWQDRQVEMARSDRDRVSVEAGGKGDGSGSTRGMTLGPDGFGTVVAAPEVIAREEGLSLDQSATLSPGVARFVRGIPIPAPEGGQRPPPRVCTLESPPIWSGRLVLIDGCLRIHEDGADAPGPLLLASVSLYRDEDDFLTASINAGLARHEIRVGAPNVRFTGMGCSMDGPVPAPPALGRACGIGEMRRVSVMERRRYCTAEDRARREQLRREHLATERRLQSDRAACIARGEPVRACPPGVAPPPPDLVYLACVDE